MQQRNRRYAMGMYPLSDDVPSGACGCRTVEPKSNESDTGCRSDADLKGCHGMMLAMAYVKSQPFENIYSCTEGFRRGTIFADLDLPFGGV